LGEESLLICVEFERGLTYVLSLSFEKGAHLPFVSEVDRARLFPVSKRSLLWNTGAVNYCKLTVVKVLHPVCGPLLRVTETVISVQAAELICLTVLLEARSYGGRYFVEAFPFLRRAGVMPDRLVRLRLSDHFCPERGEFNQSVVVQNSF